MSYVMVDIAFSEKVSTAGLRGRRGAGHLRLIGGVASWVDLRRR
jgi:hypothetical protein